jgi:undecaprenyl diphosphate synthase
MAAVLPATAADEADAIEAQLDLSSLPAHIAIIMDGNGRWGEQNGKSRCDGHLGGVEAIRRVVTACSDLGIKYLSLYSFSTENSNRPPDEVRYLFDLFARTMAGEVEGLHAKNVRVIITGLLDWLPEEPAGEFRRAVERTADNTGLTLNLCVMYSGRAELIDAARAIACAARKGELDPARLSERVFRSFLYHPEVPDPDLVIRSSGEQRISNFLLWQIAYSELVFSEVLWPDYSRADLLAALREYQYRHRRFGGL